MPNNPCFTFQSNEHQGEHCPITPSVRDMMAEHANVVGQYKPPTNAPYGNTYNPNWRNHPNLSWKPKPPPYVPSTVQQQCGPSSQPQTPPSSSPVEQAIMNLRKVVGNFVEEQKPVNARLIRESKLWKAHSIKRWITYKLRSTKNMITCSIQSQG